MWRGCLQWHFHRTTCTFAVMRLCWCTCAGCMNKCNVTFVCISIYKYKWVCKCREQFKSCIICKLYALSRDAFLSAVCRHTWFFSIPSHFWWLANAFAKYAQNVNSRNPPSFFFVLVNSSSHHLTQYFVAYHRVIPAFYQSRINTYTNTLMFTLYICTIQYYVNK